MRYVNESVIYWTTIFSPKFPKLIKPINTPLVVLAGDVGGIIKNVYF